MQGARKKMSCEDILLNFSWQQCCWQGHSQKTQNDNWGGGVVYSYIRVLPHRFLLKSIVFTVCKHEYMNIHPPNYRVQLRPGCWQCWTFSSTVFANRKILLINSNYKICGNAPYFITLLCLTPEERNDGMYCIIGINNVGVFACRRYDSLELLYMHIRTLMH